MAAATWARDEDRNDNIFIAEIEVLPHAGGWLNRNVSYPTL
jgi:hypothetical protein